MLITRQMIKLNCSSHLERHTKLPRRYQKIVHFLSFKCLDYDEKIISIISISSKQIIPDFILSYFSTVYQAHIEVEKHFPGSNTPSTSKYNKNSSSAL